MKEIFIIIVGSILVKNIVLSQFLGICPFLGVSKQVETSIGMGAAVTFVMAIASIITWMIQRYVLVPLGIEYLQTIAFILVIASLVQFVEMVVQKTSPGLYQALGVFLPLITTNCAVLGVAIINIQKDYNFIETVMNGVANAIGFTLAIVLFAGIRERLEIAEVPAALKGTPIALVVAGLMAVAFLGFTGLM